jgi:hypothetical protein
MRSHKPLIPNTDDFFATVVNAACTVGGKQKSFNSIGFLFLDLSINSQRIILKESSSYGLESC